MISNVGRSGFLRHAAHPRLWSWITVLLFLGLVVPLLLATWHSLSLQREALDNARKLEMEKLADILANGMSDPIWHLIPESGKAIVESALEDPRIISIVVTSLAQSNFLKAERAPTPDAELRTILRNVIRSGETIGKVALVVDVADRGAVGWAARRRIAIVSGIQLILSLGVVIFVVAIVRQLERSQTLRESNEKLRKEIDERQMAQQAMRESEERLRSVIENFPSILALRDVDGRYRLVNRRYEEWFGIPDNTLIGKSPCEVFDPETADRWAGGDRLIVENLRPIEKEFDISFADGEIHQLQLTKFPVFGPDNEVSGIAEIGLDLTEQRKAEARLRQSQKMELIGQLTGGVAHDFNNLLAVILGNLELLHDQLSDEGQLSMIDAGIRATNRGADLTRNMLAFARKSSLTPKVIDLNRLVSETRDWAGRTLPANISIKTSLFAGLWKIKADHSSTESALLNLILNARDAMPNGGQLTLETANIRVDQNYIATHHDKLEPGWYVMLAVSDTGHGISNDDVGRIFEPFYTTKPPGSGSGLGLSMILGFMKQSKGNVLVYSERGIGTTFKLYFRAHGDYVEPIPAVESAVGERQTGSRRLLVVEDEPEVLKLIVVTLESAGYVVVSAKTGDEAREIFEADPEFDLLLTDIALPGTLQGTTLSKELRAIDPDLRVVYMSGYASEAIIHGNGLRPEDIRLMKPVMRVDLLEAIMTSLQK